MSAKVAPKDLPCPFESLANKYDESQLARSETKQSQTWRYAAAIPRWRVHCSAAAKSIMELAKYFMNCLY